MGIVAKITAMYYHYDQKTQQIQIISETGVIIAFITAKYFEHYPYFDWVCCNIPF